MPEHALHGAKISTSLEQVRRKRVAQHMGRDAIRSNSRNARDFANAKEEVLSRHRPTPSGEIDRVTVR
jgi:hypothetical protein